MNESFYESNCKYCSFIMTSEKGCIKFSLTKEEIDKGPYVHTLKHGSFFMTEETGCPVRK